MKTIAAIHVTESAAVSTILVVEDDVIVRLVIADYLRHCGYQVHEAANAGEATAILESPEVAVDIVFAEAGLKGEMDGFGLARWVRENKPQIAIILTSTVDRAAELAGTLCEAGPMLAKPYAPQAVVDRIKQLLARGARGAARRERKQVTQLAEVV